MQLLQKARSLLILLGGNVDQDTALASISLARKFSAYLLRETDTGESFAFASRITGILTASLAELRKHASRIVIVGEDPARTHPRFWEFVGEKKKQNAIWLGTTSILEKIRWLRLKNKNHVSHLADTELETVSGNILKSASGVVFVNSDSIASDVNALSEVFLWLQELADNKKWFGQVLSSSVNENGVSQVLREQAGFSGRMRFDRGAIHHDSRLLKFSSLIENQEVDTVLVIGDQLPLGRDNLSGIKLIGISPHKPNFQVDAWLPSAQVGIDAIGTMLRLDGLPIQFSSLFNSGVPTASECLEKLLQEVVA